MSGVSIARVAGLVLLLFSACGGGGGEPTDAAPMDRDAGGMDAAASITDAATDSCVGPTDACPVWSQCPFGPSMALALEGMPCAFTSGCTIHYDWWHEPLPGDPDRLICGARNITCESGRLHVYDGTYGCPPRFDADAGLTDGGDASAGFDAGDSLDASAAADGSAASGAPGA